MALQEGESTQFEVHCVRSGSELCISVAGELDLASVGELDDALRSAEALNPTTVRLDLSELEFMDAVGLGTIIAGHRRATRNGHRLRLVSGPPHVQRVFELTGSDRELSFEHAA